MPPIPGPLRLPLLGNAWWVAKEGGSSRMVPMLRKMYARWGEVVSLGGLGEETVVVFDPRVWAQKRARRGVREIAMAFGTDTWQATRTAMQRTLLSPQAAARYASSVDRVARRAAKELAMSCGRIDLHRWLQQLSFDMVCGAVLGAPLPRPVDGGMHPLLAATVRSMECASGMLMSPLGKKHATMRTRLWRDWQASLQFMVEHSKADVARALGAPPAYGFSYAHDLVESGAIDADAVAANMPGLLMAGFETVASTLHWTLIHLGSNPEAQATLRAEIAAVVGSDELSRGHVRRLHYLKAVQREVHRLTPTAFMFVRMLDEATEVVLGSGKALELPAKLFRPERFLSSNIDKSALIHHPLMRDGFSVGPRMCLGARVAHLELVAATAAVMQAVEVQCDATPWEIHNHASTYPSPAPQLSFRVL
ncbi:25-hydroxyvitamin D3 1alpha-hydroxylase [Thecamonas trahens ATCC 50062]|uniref:25-hydroxyvitamin D3 1alpha-hydroxylase n=1 Tax=Thecamonas trahens ATCC 50062 TaxID=461836 RepID=A0A0L0DBZ2_THETB|nr:25-hydroxyvitamin D3 1alpha-hydroxylase [Thecamonas trahens ATCC 50062]KNC49869.1 25-hydroxyvitamin D3 1alpha-hydroxylase [Thecamonas trahens ATCC 50062]|eukprot:XP_013757353.1 25-hydroxyvitamin D3 1alpha-hydroxylase [Thecamonas trahens ATCC 50062]